MNQNLTIDKILVFDVWGDYAHFRRSYTTTSPLTFSIPPRTALCGLIGAILGLEKEDNEYLKYFTINEAKIGLRLLNSSKKARNLIKKVRIAENLINTKTAKGIGMNLIGKKDRTQISFEFLKDPRYRIYFWHNDNKIYNKLKDNLSEHKSVYTPCFGLSENIANFKFVGELNTTAKETNKKVLLHSVIPNEKVLKKSGINFDSGCEYFSVRIPVEMNRERIVIKYSDVLFERNGNPIEVKMAGSFWEISHDDRTKEQIVFIE